MQNTELKIMIPILENYQNILKYLSTTWDLNDLFEYNVFIENILFLSIEPLSLNFLVYYQTGFNGIGKLIMGQS